MFSHLHNLCLKLNVTFSALSKNKRCVTLYTLQANGELALGNKSIMLHNSFVITLRCYVMYTSKRYTVYRPND